MIAVAAMLFGCAGTDEGINDTTAIGDTTISETQTMAGDTNYDYDVVADPSDTYEEIFGVVEDPVAYDDMFDDIEETERYDVVTLLKSSPNLSTFVKLLEKADMIDDIQRLEEVTVLAPTNKAFAQMPRPELERLLMPDNEAQLMLLLQTHILPSKISTANVNTMHQIELGDDRHIPVNVDNDGQDITFGDATIIVSDVEGSNGFIHVVDGVIEPTEDSLEDDIRY
ncbi:putative surface protein with fasciclin (FAS1) repeats [Pontibacter ummariensis]|uniref:Uncaracterized surface protein containing fasciclin (FAS1) repeats n=2 Tax=Pontibacter ummariensis TaxID=1610492 RepID=A0A239G6N4_9BACT|nr:putative surface protein with fasciclin (FAS1) repeats [Pontibacter ummariensis]SNS64837.1 Uncaracterized surface protein containing fasciclin (FAS1) repeats [Pontibacter ummariensis]